MESLPSNIDTKIRLALVLLKISTCRTTFPDDDLSRELVNAAVYYMALDMQIKEKFEKHAATPFQSETIGSYSYSKLATAASNGDKTEVMWFDMAVDNLSQCSLASRIGESAGGGISVFEYDFPAVGDGMNITRLLSPAEIEIHSKYVGGQRCNICTILAYRSLDSNLLDFPTERFPPGGAL